MKAAGIQPQFERWAERALILLQDEGLLVRRPEGLVPAGPAPDLALPDEVDGRTRRAVALLHRAAGLLPQVLTGARPAADLLFVDGGTEDAAYLYDAWFAGANLQLQAALRAWLEREAAGGVRALEVGAGVGSTTRYLLPLVAAAGGTYVFTDLSAWFFEEARRRFGDVPGFTLARYDLDNPRHELSHDQHDLIIASSVVHVAARLDQALARLRALLRPGGLLLMIEETRFQPVFNLTMGLQTGFDNAADGRAPHPLLDGPRWEDALQRAGFVAARALEAPGTASDVMGIKAVIAVASGAASVSARGLLEHLSAALPPYMVPSEIYLLDALPLSANGKVDRGRLPSPSARSRVGVPPAPGVEASVAAVWADVLGRADIAADDHFFELGGDSLQIISVKRALKEQLGLEVPVAALFEHPTVAALARYLERTPAADPADRVEQRAAAAADARRRRRSQEVR